jgi:hypothetical protein
MTTGNAITRKPITALVLLLALAGSATAQAVSFEELENQTVTASFIYEQTIRRLEDKRVLNNENRQTMILKIGPGNKIDQEYKVQIVAPNGREVGGYAGNISAELNKPTKWRHGEMVFLFDQGSLVRLQTFDAGGRKITVTFKRGKFGIDCSVDAPFSKEEGAGSAVSTPGAVDRRQIEILSAKVKTSACRVAKTASQG